MKKTLSLILSLLCLFTSVACSSKSSAANTSNEDKNIRVVATLEPHSTILESIRPQLQAKGYQLEITVVDDYFTPNRSVNDKEADANYFQHIPFFDGDVASHGYHLSNAGGVHIEPFGFYSKTIRNISELADGATVVISNSPADNGRILHILQQNGLIKIKEGVPVVNALLSDIVENPKNLQFKEVKPEILTLSLENNEGDLVAINGNFAISAGLNPIKDAVLLEKGDETNPYVNIVAVRTEDLGSAKINALMEALQSEETKKFIREHYGDGSVIPATK